MQESMDSNGLHRKEAMPIGNVLKMFLQANRLVAPHNTHLIFDAWDRASGASKFTLKRFFRDGKLYVTLSSSVIRSQLYFQKDALVEKINAILAEEELFIPTAAAAVKDIILK